MLTPNLSPLKGFNSFKNVYEISVKSHFGTILLFIASKPCPILIKGKELDTNSIYLGISVQKKLFKKAVVRNRIKRLIRESVRKNIAQLSQSFSFEPVQVLLVSFKGETIEKPSRIKLADIERDLSPALLKFCNHYLKKVEKSV
jgi:ribonuclease P protein component